MQYVRVLGAALAASLVLLCLPARAAASVADTDWDPTFDPDIIVIGPGTT